MQGAEKVLQDAGDCVAFYAIKEIYKEYLPSLTHEFWFSVHCD